jgi:hypothetical protein
MLPPSGDKLFRHDNTVDNAAFGLITPFKMCQFWRVPHAYHERDQQEAGVRKL